MEGILQSKHLEEYEADSYNCLNWHSVAIVHLEVDESVNLAGSVEVYFYDGVVPVEVDELLEEEGRGDFWFCDDEGVYLGCGWVLGLDISRLDRSDCSVSVLIMGWLLPSRWWLLVGSSFNF